MTKKKGQKSKNQKSKSKSFIRVRATRSPHFTSKMVLRHQVESGF